MDMRFGIWNVRSLYSSGSLMTVVKEISKYWVFRAQADWTFILPSELPAKELHHLPRKMPLGGTMH
jgi:hypothetical protein